MRANEIILERKKKARKKSKKLGNYFFPGYAYFGSAGSETDSSDGGGGEAESISESPAIELADRLPSLKKHDYDTIDRLMKTIAKKHKITDKALHNLFIKKYKSTPDHWIKNKLDEMEIERAGDIKKEVDLFVDWAKKRLKIESNPKIELSHDTYEAQVNHHTGSHTDQSNKIWVYVKNRNLVDILRTVYHELVHVRQGEKNMIKPGSSYPGSPIEVQADALAGKAIKLYGEANHRIFQ